MEYDFEFSRINREIRKKKPRRILIQLPEGLKQYSRHIMDKINAAGAEIILSGDHCFGACDVRESDLTIHFGHSKMLPTKNIIYVECRTDLDCVPVVKNAASPFEKVGLVTTVQHIGELEKIKKALSADGKKVFIGRRGPAATYDGQVLGCDFNAATSIADKVDAIIFIGSGRFHPLGLAYATGKKIIQANPYNSHVSEVSIEWEREKYMRIAAAKDAESFGIINGTKPGQRHQYAQIKKALEKRGKRAYVIEIDEITPEKVDYLPFDAFVILACPRLVLDDWKNFKKAILLPDEAREV